MGYRYSYLHILKTLVQVSFFMRLRGAPSCISFFSVQHALRGYCKVHVVANNKLPISADLLSRICAATSAVYFSTYGF